MPSNYDAFIDQESSGDGYGRDNAKKKLGRHRANVQNSLRLRKDSEWDDKWSNLIKIYSNKYPWDELGSYEDIVVPNMAFSTVNVIVPSIAVNIPKVNVTAKNPKDRETAAVVEAVVNHHWREFDVQDEIRAAAKDFVIVGHGWVKITWETKMADRELSVDEWQDAVREQVMMQQQLAQSGVLEDDLPTMDEVIESVPRTVEETVKDAPLVRRISPFDMVVDPDALRMQDLRWIAQRSFVPIQVARENEDWQPSARRKLKATVLSDARDDVKVDDSHRSKDAGFVVVYEYYDLINETVCVFADGCEEFLQKPSQSPFPGVHPFVFMPNYEVPERFYPIGDLETIYGLQLELAMTRTAMINDRKHGKRIHMVRSAAIGPEGMQALESGDDDVLIDVLEDRPFGDVLQSVQPTALHPEWYTQSDMILNDINMISGVTEYSRGQAANIRRTATEAGLIQDAANARSSDKLYKIEQAMGRVAERMIKLSQVFMDTEDVARVIDENKVVSWVRYDRTVLQGDFVFEVEAGSSQPHNESFRRQSALQLMDVLSPMLGSGLLNDQKIIEHVLRFGFGIKNADQMMGPGPQPPMPEAAPPGMPPEGMPPEMPPGMPPEMAGIPPEMLAQMMGGGGMPPQGVPGPMPGM